MKKIFWISPFLFMLLSLLMLDSITRGGPSPSTGTQKMIFIIYPAMISILMFGLGSALNKLDNIITIVKTKENENTDNSIIES